MVFAILKRTVKVFLWIFYTSYNWLHSWPMNCESISAKYFIGSKPWKFSPAKLSLFTVIPNCTWHNWIVILNKDNTCVQKYRLSNMNFANIRYYQYAYMAILAPIPIPILISVHLYSNVLLTPTYEQCYLTS